MASVCFDIHNIVQTINRARRKREREKRSYGDNELIGIKKSTVEKQR